MKNLTHLRKVNGWLSHAQTALIDAVYGTTAARSPRPSAFGKASLFLMALALVTALAGADALAQGVGGGGQSIFGQNETMLPNAMRNTVIFIFGMAFLFGAAAICWGVTLYTRRQDCLNWIIGGALCMVAGGVVAGAVYLASGQRLAVPNTLSWSGLAESLTYI